MVKYRKYILIFLSSAALGAFPGTGGMRVMGQELHPGEGQVRETREGQVRELHPGWNQFQDDWYWAEEDGSLHKGWLQEDGRRYYMDENGRMVRGWKEVNGDWYYFHQDGGMNLGELVLGNARYGFLKNGALENAGWVENTGGGAYNAGCYDQETQALFDDLNEEKKQLYFDRHPGREKDNDGDVHKVYDRNAGFLMDMTLNKAAGHRLKAAMEHGYADGRISGEGTVKDYLSAISYRKNASCLELYIRACEDWDTAFSKVDQKTSERYDAKGDRKYSLEYYRSLGMAHGIKDGKHYFMIILMR